MKVVVVGDIIVSEDILYDAALQLSITQTEDLEIVKLNWHNASREEFQARAQNLEINGPDAENVPEELYEEITDADILLVHFCPVSEKLLEKASKLKLIGTCRGGLEHIDVKAATKKKIPVIHVIRNAEATSDLAVGLMFAEARNIARSHAAIMQGHWRKDYVNSNYTTSMRNLKVGIVGLGNIGKLVAEKCLGLGMKVQGYDAFISDEEKEKLSQDIDIVDKETLLKTSDIISIHLRLSDLTKDFIDAKALDMMKETAYLINTSRAGCVNEDALYEALDKQIIGGAGLDVFWEEPLESKSRWLQLDNVTLTPHTAGNVVDALPMSPYLLKDTINNFYENNDDSMVVNRKEVL